MVFLKMIRKIVCICFLLNPIVLQGTWTQQDKRYGQIKGQVIDETTQSHLIGVNVSIEESTLGTASDLKGNFCIEKVTPGSYNLRFRMMGYKMRIVSNVIVYPKRTTVLNIEMKSVVLETEGVVVTAGYFHEAKDGVVSNRSMDFEEIRSDPGSAEDVQRVVQALPSVVSGSDQDNEIIVRGGMPGENLFIMDNIEIPNPNHFGYQGTTGGPINMLNTYFVRRVDFYAGAFPARYGDRASSVMDISLRNGNNQRYTGKVYLGMSGAGAMLEGPIIKNRGSWIFSARKSFLDLIISSTGLSAVPKYYNVQGKATYDISSKHRLIINGIYGNDKITIKGEGEGGYSRGAENVDARSHQYAIGATLRSLFGGLGMSRLTCSQTLNYWNHNVYDDEEVSYYINRSTEIERTVKFDLRLLPFRRWEFDMGISGKSIVFDHNEWFNADTLFQYDTSVVPHQETDIFMTYPEWRVIRKENTYKIAAYSQAKVYPISWLTLIAGIRYDVMDYIKDSAVDPRIGLSFNLAEGMKFNIAAGKQSQAPAYISLTAHENNSNLKYKHTQQIVVGLENLFKEDMRGTLELFYKDYTNVPIPIAWTTPDPYDRSEGRLKSQGRGYAKGIEFFLQKKMSRNYHFTISYAYSISKGYDQRFDTYYNWDYDYRHIFTFISGIRFDLRNRLWYRHLSNNLIYKIFAWIIPLADQMDFSFRWRYLGGRPFTRPKYYETLHYWIIEESMSMNAHRFPPYHRLDLRLDRRFMFKGWNIVTYFDLMNVYSRDNIWEYSYQDDGSVEKILQWKVFPVGGISIEF